VPELYRAGGGCVSPVCQVFAVSRLFVEPLFSPPVVIMKFRKIRGARMRTVSALLFTALMIAPAFAYTDEQVAACTPDVMRLCSDAIPDEGRITKCMIQKRRQVSAACMLAFRSASSVSRLAAR